MFVYSLSIFFNQIAALSIGEAAFMMAGMLILIWLLTPLPEQNALLERQEHYIFACWSGNQPLRSAFWPFFISLNAALFGADWLVKSGQISVSSWDDIHFALVLPTVWWTLSVWRCSIHAKTRSCAAFARFAVLLVYVEYALKIYIRSDYARLFFGCEDILLDYVSCF